MPVDTGFLLTAQVYCGVIRRRIFDGLARQIITGMQYYSLNAEYLWDAIVVSSVLGIGAYLLVAGAEAWVLRHERREGLVAG